MKKKNNFRIEYLHRPGRFWTEDEHREYVSALEDVAADCFRQIPRYQCLTGNRQELIRNVITIARDDRGRPIGFCSAVILDIEGYPNILHLGLTCVKKSARSKGLTHALTSRLLMNYLLRTSPFKNIWITNVACVLSSLGNIAMHFENVYPSPFGKTAPTIDHLRIAQAVDQSFRDPVAINAGSVFDPVHFVFRGSVGNTVFQKSARDRRYYHRDEQLTQFYLKRMNFKNGDEVLQVGMIGIFSYPRYMTKLFAMTLSRSLTLPIRRVKTALFNRR